MTAIRRDLAGLRCRQTILGQTREERRPEAETPGGAKGRAGWT